MDAAHTHGCTSDPSPWAMGVIVAAGALGTSSVAPALPSISADLHLGFAATAAVVSTFTVPFASTAIVGGQLVDRLGAGRVLPASIVMALFGLALATTADAGLPLLVGRAVHGAGSSVAAIAAYSAARRRPGGLGTVAAALTIGSAGGPLLGGLVTQAVTWRVAVGLPAPLLLVALVVSLPRAHSPRPVDVRGTVLVFSGAMLTASALQMARHAPAVAGALLPLGLSLLAAAGTRSLHRPMTVPEGALLRDRQVRSTASVAMTCAATYFATMVIAPLGLGSRGWGPIGIGMLLLPGAAVGAWSSRNSERTGRRLGRWTEPAASSLILVTLLLVIAGDAVMAALSLTVLSAAFGMVQPRLMNQVSTAVDQHPATALGTANLVFLLGGGMGAAVVGGLGAGGGSRSLLLVALGVAAASLRRALGPHRDG